MEQIDINLVITNSYISWSKYHELERNELLARFSHSIPVATSYNEMDYVRDWLIKIISPKGDNWESIFYYKEDYDFGYAEYFFSKEEFLIIFKNEIPKVYGVFGEEKLRTNCEGEYFNVD